jgi:phage terminase small subunit
METRERYSEYPTKIQQYMKSLILEIQQDYGCIPASWWISLDILADQLNIYFMASKDVLEKGVSHINRENRQVKNPSITTINNCVASINSIIKNFALSPVGRSKIKLLESVDSEAAVDNYVKSLTE